MESGRPGNVPRRQTLTRAFCAEGGDGSRRTANFVSPGEIDGLRGTDGEHLGERRLRTVVVDGCAARVQLAQARGCTHW